MTPRPKQTLLRSEPYRRLVAALPCIHCNIDGHSQAAHPPPRGKGIKESDLECFPLCSARPGITGCHADFDQYRLLPKSDMRPMATYWAADTQRQIIRNGSWPKNLQQPEIEI